MRMFSKYHHDHIKRGEFFTVECVEIGRYQAIYPEMLSERYGSTYSTEHQAWEAIKKDCQHEGIELVDDDNGEAHLRSFP